MKQIIYNLREAKNSVDSSKYCMRDESDTIKLMALSIKLDAMLKSLEDE